MERVKLGSSERRLGYEVGGGVDEWRIVEEVAQESSASWWKWAVAGWGEGVDSRSSMMRLRSVEASAKTC